MNHQTPSGGEGKPRITQRTSRQIDSQPQTCREAQKGRKPRTPNTQGRRQASQSYQQTRRPERRQSRSECEAKTSTGRDHQRQLIDEQRNTPACRKATKDEGSQENPHRSRSTDDEGDHRVRRNQGRLHPETSTTSRVDQRSTPTRGKGR